MWHGDHTNTALLSPGGGGAPMQPSTTSQPVGAKYSAGPAATRTDAAMRSATNCRSGVPAGASGAAASSGASVLSPQPDAASATPASPATYRRTCKSLRSLEPHHYLDVGG